MYDDRFPEKYPIDHETLKQATADYLTIKNAGYVEQFNRELTDVRMEQSSEDRGKLNHHSGSITKIYIDWAARDLAKLLGCAQNVVAAEIFEQTGPTERQIAVELLAKMAGEVRKLQSASFSRTRRTA